jgi:hypothetical protein
LKVGNGSNFVEALNVIWGNELEVGNVVAILAPA